MFCLMQHVFGLIASSPQSWQFHWHCCGQLCLQWLTSAPSGSSLHYSVCLTLLSTTYIEYDMTAYFYSCSCFFISLKLFFFILIILDSCFYTLQICKSKITFNFIDFFFFLFQVWSGLVRAFLDPFFNSAALLFTAIRTRRENVVVSA